MKYIVSFSITLFILLTVGCGPPQSLETPQPTATNILVTATVQPTSTPIQITEVPPEPTLANIYYAGDDNPNHTLDIYLPTDATGALPTLLMLHGAPGAKNDLIEIGDYFADQGYAVVIPEYEYGNEIQFAFQDVFCSLGWVYANPDQYDFDLQSIYIFGFSFGSYLSASVGTFKEIDQYLEDCPYSIPKTDRVKGVITFAGMFITQEVCMAPEGGWCMAAAANDNKIPLMDMANIFESLREIPSSKWKDSNELDEAARNFAQTLPLYWLDGSEPPFLIIHGDADDMVSIVESEAFVRAVQAAGGDAEFVSIPGAGHFSLNLASPSFEKISGAILTFTSP